MTDAPARPRPLLWAIAPLAALAGIVLAAALVLARPAAPSLQGQPAGVADLTLPALAGGAPVRTADFAGRPYLVNFFASWCEPCLAEHPALMALEAQGVVIVGVAFKDRPEATAAFLARHGDPYRAVGLDPQGQALIELGASGVPETFVMGADGSVLLRHRSALDPITIRDKVLPALGLAAPPPPPAR